MRQSPKALRASSLVLAHTLDSSARSAHEKRCVSVLAQRIGMGYLEHSQRQAATRLENTMCIREGQTSIRCGPSGVSSKASNHASPPVRCQRLLHLAREVVDDIFESGWTGQRALRAWGVHIPSSALHGRRHGPLQIFSSCSLSERAGIVV